MKIIFILILIAVNSKGEVGTLSAPFASFEECSIFAQRAQREILLEEEITSVSWQCQRFAIRNSPERKVKDD